MKKSILVLVFSLLFFFPLISAVEFAMNDNFSQGETIVAKISGNFITPITNANVFFYRGHVQIPIQYDVANLNGDYYIYAITTGKSSEDDYSLSIKNIQYMKGADVSNETLAKNFTITNETAAFSVNPGVIVASDNFSIEVQNLLDNQITLQVNTITGTGKAIFIPPNNLEQYSFSINSGDIQKINFNGGSGESAVQAIELSAGNFTFSLPVYLSSSSGLQSSGLSFTPSEFAANLLSNSTSTQTFFLYNNGGRDITNISLSLSSSLRSIATLSQTQIASLTAGSHVPIDVSFSPNSEEEIDGVLQAAAGNFSANSYITLSFSSNSSNQTQANVPQTCAELNGTICNGDNQKCDTTPVYASDNVCCLTKCQQVQKSSSGTIIAIIIIVLIAGLLLWFYFKKYKKAKKPVDFVKIAQGKK